MRSMPDRAGIIDAPTRGTGPARRHVAVTSDGDEIGARLLAAACRREHSAFVAVLRHYDRRLRLVAYRLLRDRELVDDALQDVALKAFRALPHFRGEASVGTWLHSITRTTCLDYLRRSRPLELIPPDQLPEVHRGVAADTAELVVGRDDLRRRLAVLPPKQRLAVLLVDHWGYDYRSAAEILGIPPGTLGSRLNTAHAVLRRRLR
jgi:RNA polymerase sigma-70 factor (ECF subfamily)